MGQQVPRDHLPLRAQIPFDARRTECCFQTKNDNNKSYEEPKQQRVFKMENGIFKFIAKFWGVLIRGLKRKNAL
jgi:hypothetical protein